MSKLDVYRRSLRHQLNFAGDALLSGDPEHIAEAREFVAIHRDAAAEWNGHDLVDRVKRWIHQSPEDPETRSIEFLETLYRDALAADPVGQESWWLAAAPARATRFAGRFQMAQSLFAHAMALIDRAREADEPYSQRMADVYAEYADHLTYLGFPAQGREILARIPDYFITAWHRWNDSWCVHLLGFVEANTSGQPVASLVPTSEERYHESNGIIDELIPMLAEEEQSDLMLSKVANWGAIKRIREAHGGDVEEAEDQCEIALAAFRNAPAGSANPTWSIKKEMRGGRLPVMRLPTDPVQGIDAVRAWR